MITTMITTTTAASLFTWSSRIAALHTDLVTSHMKEPYTLGRCRFSILDLSRWTAQSKIAETLNSRFENSIDK
ncbi:hypothetical protein F5Y14DRAFT_396099 [Nemania sp. NC0429]|nr:hypothetical protein F5Y14DRAFT_396099 [Nemania sp. NC0429]